MFATKFEGFTDGQVQVIQAACTAMEGMATRSIDAPQNMALWFGAGQNVAVNEKLRKMNRVIADAGRTVTFVNRTGGHLGVRHQSLYNKQLLPVGQEENLVGVIAYAHPVDRRNEAGAKRTETHVGSGMRIYLNDVFFTLSADLRAATVYHELTHKVLATEDHAYDPGPCQALALNSPAMALENADNFGLFVAQC